MKTTLDLPDELVREMKMRAASEGRKLRDVATEVFRRGLAQSPPQPHSEKRRVTLPLIKCKQASGKMSSEQVAHVLMNQEVEWSHEAAGP